MREVIKTSGGFRTITALELVDVLVKELGSVRALLRKAKLADSKGELEETDMRINQALVKLVELDTSFQTLNEWWKEEYSQRRSAILSRLAGKEGKP